MIFHAIRSNIPIDDNLFNTIYPASMYQIAQRHWTPIHVAKMAAHFLVTSQRTRVLDIGAGVGKFCLIGASCTDGLFYGVEQRATLVDIAKQIAQKHQINNAKFIHANMNEIEFNDYDSFYFFNSFYENIDSSCPIDNLIKPDRELYHLYTEQLKSQLDLTTKGTRLACYWSGRKEVPDSFSLAYSACEGLLNFYVKIR